MKKLIYCLLSVFVFATTSCFKDESALGKDFIPDIEIAELRDTSIVSYAGNVLTINPQLKTTYAEDELSYAWYIYDANKSSTTETGLNGFRTKKISEEKMLSYEVDLPSGTYGIVFEVTAAKYAYSRRATMELATSTEFSKGFYVLKETADKRTDLDLAIDGKLNEDILTHTLGDPLEGKPLNLSVVYGQGYIDEETQKMAYTKALNVFTEKDYRAFRTEDLMQIHDRNTIFYDKHSDDEVIYSLQQGSGFATFLFTNKGYYGGVACGDMWGMVSESSGKYGFPINSGSSKFAQQIYGGSEGVVFWNETERALNWADDGASICRDIDYSLPLNMDAATAVCVASGTNYLGDTETVWFLIEASGKRCLITFNSSPEVSEIRDIDSELRFAQADIIAGNALSADIIYFVSDNTLWAYNLSGGGEFEIPLPGVQGTINYITNAYLNVGYLGVSTENFDNLIVATSLGENYNLYLFDNMVGGAPQAAVEPYSGTGTVRCVRFVPSVQVTLTDLSTAMDVGPLSPWTD